MGGEVRIAFVRRKNVGKSGSAEVIGSRERLNKLNAGNRGGHGTPLHDPQTEQNRAHTQGKKNASSPKPFNPVATPKPAPNPHKNNAETGKQARNNPP
jgi:hypothetical protein